MPQIFKQIISWIFIISLIGLLSGSASAFFLTALEWVTNFRENNLFIIIFLPIGGLLIGLGYHYWGQSVAKGNNQILEQYQNPTAKIPFKMAPLVLIGTLITHLFGGSAGREGTAVQMSAAVSDQFSHRFGLLGINRKTILQMGIAAGFAAVFGTPLAGAFFAFETTLFNKKNSWHFLPILAVSFLADFVCKIWQVSHTHYVVSEIPSCSVSIILICVLVGLLAGLASFTFSRMTHFWHQSFGKLITYPPFRPLIGGAILALIFMLSDSGIYVGLGIPTIVASFSEVQMLPVFALKILFTSFTLGAGFKGGEVTPLFFIGATLGSALSAFLPAPIAFLAAIGFVAVFAGATHTPLASALMGMELFGFSMAFWVLLTCYVAYFSSGTKGIYSAQELNVGKKWFYKKLRWF